MRTRLFDSHRERQGNRSNHVVPRLEPLEDRLTPSGIPPLNPIISNQLTLGASLLAQQSTQPPSNQLTNAFLFFYVQSALQSPADTNALARADGVLAADLEVFAIDAQLQVMDPALNSSFMSVQNAIINNPVRNTPAGSQANILATALGLKAITAPSTQPVVAAFQFSYTQAYQQNPNLLSPLNGLVEAEVVATLDQIYTLIDPLFGINDPTLSANLANAQNAIAANPAHATMFGALTGQLAQGLTLSAFLAPA